MCLLNPRDKDWDEPEVEKVPENFSLKRIRIRFLPQQSAVGR
jgi:hypothetical protein